jgi:hypothetical protein
MPAAVARRYCPALRTWAEQLASRGLKPLQVRGALMRKLLLAAFAVLKHRTPFDPAKLCLPKPLDAQDRVYAQALRAVGTRKASG